MNDLSRRVLRCSGVLLLLLQLGGCVEMVVGGAVVGGMAVSDRRTLGAQTEDNSLIVRGENLAAKIAGDGNHVNVSSFNRRVLLTGEVKDEATKSRIESEIRKLDGAQDVINELEVCGVSSLTSRSSDTLITTKVKTGLLTNKQIYANSIKIVTERGTVYLMGRVTEQEGNLAAEIARTASGVMKVVKLFEYISEEEKKRLTPQQPPSQTQP